MKLQDRMYLESKLLKYIREDNQVSITGELSAKGHFLSDIIHKMWYFVRKNNITDHDVFKVARRLEAQGFIEIIVLKGRVYLKAPASTQNLPTEEEVQISNRDARRHKPTEREILEAKLVARRYLASRERQEMLLTKQQEQSTPAEPAKEQFTTETEISIEEDQASLEDYLKDE